MKQSLTIRLAALFVSVVITAVLFEQVAELGHPALCGQSQVALATVVDSASFQYRFGSALNATSSYPATSFLLKAPFIRC